MRLKFVPDLFLGSIEMQRFQESIQDNGFTKYIAFITENYGLIKKRGISAFSNALVEQDVSNSLGQITIKVNPIEAIDSNGNFLLNAGVGQLPVPADQDWYWLRVKYIESTIEAGIVSIDVDGNLSGVGTKFLSTLRGVPDFPSRIRFENSVGNQQEYDVLDVISDTSAILSHPTMDSINTPVLFTSETLLKYSVVGTFTPGIAVPNDNKYPFIYDDAQFEFVKEVTANVPPTYVSGVEFYLCRVRVQGSILEIQDKRTDIYMMDNYMDVLTTANPLIGVENIKWNNSYSPRDRNLVQIAWGMRSRNWTIDTSQNICTLLGGSFGGKYKTPADFQNNDFNGWRLYTRSGKYQKVILSVKQGGAINLKLDVLNIDEFSPDGGISFYDQELVIVPDVDNIIISARGIVSNDNVFQLTSHTIASGFAVIDLQAYADPECLYNIQYRYERNGRYTAYLPLPSDTVGYYTEESFNIDGLLLSVDDRKLYPYVGSATDPYIRLLLSPNSYVKFNEQIYKGDIYGVNTIESFQNVQIMELEVGRSKSYQYIIGNVTISDNLIISLSRNNTKPYNKFTIHFDCTSLALSNYKIQIIDAYGASNIVLKEIIQGDVYCMLNQLGGIVFDIVFTDQGKWILSQNYSLGRPKQLIQLDGEIDELFTNEGWGKVRGLFGHALADGRNLTPNLSDRFVKGPTLVEPPSSVGGANARALLEENMVPHSHLMTGRQRDANTSGSGGPALYIDMTPGNGPNSVLTGMYGGDFISGDAGPKEAKSFDNQPGYYVVIFAKKMF